VIGRRAVRPAGRRLAGACLALVAAAGPAAAELGILIAPAAPNPGDIVLFHVAGGPADLTGEWHGRPLHFFPVPDGMMALAGVDLEAEPGPLVWRLSRPSGEGEVVVGVGAVSVGARLFPVQRLTLPRAQVDLDRATLARVRAEQAELQAAIATATPDRLWRGPFREPIAGGRPTGRFGLQRVINGQPRQPHAGYDWAAPRGTPVLAANAGRVGLVTEQFFAGRLVLLDHGQGLFTMYFHLEDARVAAGERVTAGQRLGSVGATGRASGPHLHFGVLVGGARVDPMALLGLGLQPEP
jgi:hypothetical protein